MSSNLPNVNAEPTSDEPNAEEKQWAMFAHLAAFAGFVIPFGNILGPLVVWLIKKDTMPFVDEQGKESLNFQITIAIAGVICVILMFVLIGILLAFALGICFLIFTIIAAVAANKGESYRYPFVIRLIK
jgi:uncharacterized protein